MKKLIRIFSQKRVKTNKIYQVLKTVEVAFATIDETTNQAKIIGGKYKDKTINLLDVNCENEDFVYDIINENLLLIGKSFRNEIELLDSAKETYENQYYYIDKLEDRIGIRECRDEAVINNFEIGVNPSVEASLSTLFETMKINGENGFTIPADLTQKMLGKTDSLEEQDTNKYKKKFSDYDINSKYEELKQIIIGQDSQLKILLANLIKNVSLSYSELDIQKIRNLKSKILIIGGTGTGKTLMVENIASMLNVPYVIEDAKRYTSNGYIGEDVENMLMDLYHVCGENMEKFEHGIIFIDEVDKLCNVKDERSHVATTDVQEALLKLLDGSIITKTINRGIRSENITFDTSKITFVLAGAFDRLSNDENFDNDKILLEAGMIPELVARLNTKIVTKKPTKEELRTALIDSKYGYLKLLEEYFNLYGIEIAVTEEFIDSVIEEAFELDQGYRSLTKIINNKVNDLLFDILSGKNNKLTLENK